MPTQPASLWAAVIAASAALVAVLIGQVLQTRRENRNWARERERDADQREDQRLRDAEAREDQRRRDEQLWRREDRHRFADTKRELYARYLGRAYIRLVDTRTLIQIIRLEVQRRIDGGHVPLANVRDWVMSYHAKRYAIVCGEDGDNTLLQEVMLVAPNAIGKQSNWLGFELLRGLQVALDEVDLDAADQVMAECHKVFNELRASMQIDLRGAEDPAAT